MNFIEPIHMPCGGTAYFDESSGISYRCDTCMAVLGSIGMPETCRQIYRDMELLDVIAGRKKEFTF
jgi:hypothetical protein